MTNAPVTVKELRQHWLPHKSRLDNSRPNHPTSIRFHRACSWLEQAEQLDPVQQADGLLLYQWIAFNALYGQWDANLHEAVSDRTCWQVFLTRMLELDATGCLEAILVENKSLIIKILCNKHLNRVYWQDPETPEVSDMQKTRRRAQSWYAEKAWPVIFEQAVERVYLLRCQLVHGAATAGSLLNRTSLKHCTTFMGMALTAMLGIWIEHGADEDWGLICYPPVPRRPGT